MCLGQNMRDACPIRKGPGAGRYGSTDVELQLSCTDAAYDSSFTKS